MTGLGQKLLCVSALLFVCSSVHAQDRSEVVAQVRDGEFGLQMRVVGTLNACGLEEEAKVAFGKSDMPPGRLTHAFIYAMGYSDALQRLFAAELLLPKARDLICADALETVEMKMER